MQHHEEEALGKAYDSHLMRRLLGYLAPYKIQVFSAILIIAAASLIQLCGPYLTKIGIDRYIAAKDYDGLNRIALLYVGVIVLGSAGNCDNHFLFEFQISLGGHVGCPTYFPDHRCF